jgi:hypothetical protein
MVDPGSWSVDAQTGFERGTVQYAIPVQTVVRSTDYVVDDQTVPSRVSQITGLTHKRNDSHHQPESPMVIIAPFVVTFDRLLSSYPFAIFHLILVFLQLVGSPLHTYGTHLR